jgi:hypothetical protein
MLFGGAGSSCAVGGAATTADGVDELAGCKAGCEDRPLDNIQIAPTVISAPIAMAAFLMFAGCAAAKVGGPLPTAAEATVVPLLVTEEAAEGAVLVLGAEGVAVTARNDSGAAVSKTLSAFSN